jgi:phage-related protein
LKEAAVRVRRYTPGGADPVAKYVDDLAPREAARVAAATQAIELRGLDESGVSTRQVRGRLWELKLGAQRVFFVLISGPTMVLLHGYTKGSQRAPTREIETALARMKDVLAGED